MFVKDLRSLLSWHHFSPSPCLAGEAGELPDPVPAAPAPGASWPGWGPAGRREESEAAAEEAVAVEEKSVEDDMEVEEEV